MQRARKKWLKLFLRGRKRWRMRTPKFRDACEAAALTRGDVGGTVGSRGSKAEDRGRH